MLIRSFYNSLHRNNRNQTGTKIKKDQSQSTIYMEYIRYYIIDCVMVQNVLFLINMFFLKNLKKCQIISEHLQFKFAAPLLGTTAIRYRLKYSKMFELLPI